MPAELFPPLEENDEDDDVNDREQQLAENFTRLKDKKRPVSERQQLAAETAVLAEQEIQRWQNSIRELEALLVAQQQPAAPRGAVPQTITPTEPVVQDEESSTASSSSSPSD